MYSSGEPIFIGNQLTSYVWNVVREFQEFSSSYFSWSQAESGEERRIFKKVLFSPGIKQGTFCVITTTPRKLPVDISRLIINSFNLLFFCRFCHLNCRKTKTTQFLAKIRNWQVKLQTKSNQDDLSHQLFYLKLKWIFGGPFSIMFSLLKRPVFAPKSPKNSSQISNIIIVQLNSPLNSLAMPMKIPFLKNLRIWGNLLHHHISVDFLLAFVVHPLLAYFVPKPEIYI